MHAAAGAPKRSRSWRRGNRQSRTGVWSPDDHRHRSPATVYPANSHVIRPATAADALALHQLAAAVSARPLAGRILVAEVGGVVAAALSRDEQRTIADHALAPVQLTTLLRLRAYAGAGAPREPRLG